MGKSLPLSKTFAYPFALLFAGGCQAWSIIRTPNGAIGRRENSEEGEEDAIFDETNAMSDAELEPVGYDQEREDEILEELHRLWESG
jgi:hypothetical protein